MKRIGLFLGTSGARGGAFQYSHAVLEALASTFAKSDSVIVRYVDPSWDPIIRSYGLVGQMITRGAVAKWRDRLVLRAPLSIALWRSALARFHSVSATLIADACDLWIFPAQDAWAYLTPVRAIGTIHDLMHRYESHFPEVSERGEFKKRERHYRAMCRWATGILVDSNVGRAQVIESYAPVKAKLLVLPYIAPAHVRRPVVAEPIELPEKFLFYPAHFWQHKNHRRLVDAVAEVSQRHPDIRLVLVGAVENGYADVRSHVSELGLDAQVVFLDYVPDAAMADLYSRARGLVMPTFFGPTNIPPLEAFVLGCPVATSGIYGVPEQLGDAALLFDPTSVRDIADVLERLWMDDELCADLVRRGMDKAASWGSAEFASTLRDAIQQILDEVRDAA